MAPECGHVTLDVVQMAPKQAKVEFLSNIFQFTRLRGVAVMQGLTFRNSVVTLFKSAKLYILSLFGSRTLVTRVRLTGMRNINNPALQAERLVFWPTWATWSIKDTLVFVRAPSDISDIVLKAISNENRELLHTTPEPATRPPEAATLATLLLSEIWGVLVLPNWDNSSPVGQVRN